ncbi:MAG: TerB family tellurite resistance protein [Paracoccaceae bacterium]|nr:TerB family tellurite resistance protein [Paracoccaceae bacterium]
MDGRRRSLGFRSSQGYPFEYPFAAAHDALSDGGCGAAGESDLGVYGKILGSAAGFAWGGPLGAIVGLALGHYVVDRKGAGEKPPRSRVRSATRGRSRNDLEQAFAVAFVTLAAKLSKVDGRVTQDEIETLKRVIPIPESALSEVGSIFNAAKADASGFEPYARQLADLVSSDPVVLEQILAGLLQIAVSDGTYHRGERDFIARVSREFGFSDQQRRRIENTYLPSEVVDARDPYEVLGVNRNSSDSDVRAAYRKIIRDYHPDQLEAKGVPEEFHAMGVRKTSEANTAFDRIRKERNLAR